MGIQVTLTLPETLYRQFERQAQMENRPVTDVLMERLAISAPPPDASLVPSVAHLSDKEVNALADLQMDAEKARRMREIMDHQQIGTLTEEERQELERLIDVYDDVWLLKTAGMTEAVRRGLRDLPQD